MIVYSAPLKSVIYQRPKSKSLVFGIIRLSWLQDPYSKWDHESCIRNACYFEGINDHCKLICLWEGDLMQEIYASFVSYNSGEESTIM